jgi:putative addiction module component (TIGR02574 family)
MTPTSETLSAQAAQLTPQERIQVVERILNSLDQPDAALDALWANDASDRLAAYRRGEIKAVGLPDVIAKYQQSARYWKNQLG